MTTRALALLILFLGGFSTAAEAQYKKRYKRKGTKLDIRYGLKVGAQMSNFTGDNFLSEIDSDNLPIAPAVEYKPFFSYHAGAFVDIRLSEQLIIQPEIHYGQFGSRMRREADLTNPEQNFLVTESSPFTHRVVIPIDRRLTMVQIPLVAKIGLTRLAHLNLGPVFSFKLKEKNVYGDVPDSLVQITQFTDPFAPDIYKKIFLGALVGFSYQLENGISLALRYNRNFNNINKNEFLPLLALEPRNGTSILSFSVGYTFTYEDRLRQNIGRRY